MITTYNKYVNKKPLNEKLEIDLPNLVDTINNRVTNSFDKVKNKIFMENTSDGYEINMEDEYYAVVEYKLIKDKENEAKQALNNKIFWATLKLIKKEESFYKYDIIDTDVNIPKEHGNILDNKENIKIIKSSEEKIPVNRINGFYLYKVKSDINMVLNNYKVKYNKEDIEKKVEDTKQSITVKPGYVYEILNSKGDKVNLYVMSVKDNEVFAEDVEHDQTYNNMKLEKFQNAKKVGDVYSNIKDKIDSSKLNGWKQTDEFKEVSSDKGAAIKFIKKKIQKLKNYYSILNRLIDSETYTNKAEKGGMESLTKSIKGIITNIYQFVIKNYEVDLRKQKTSKSKAKEKVEPKSKEKVEPEAKEKVKPKAKEKVEPVEDKTETPEEKIQKEEVKDMDTKAKEVQTDIQKPVKEMELEVVESKKEPKSNEPS